jgi:hypothetical protein
MGTSDVKRTVGEPHDRLTRLCDAMLKALESNPENDENVKCIVFLDDGKRGGFSLHGYEKDTDAMVDLFMHLKALFNANGKELIFAPIHRG